MATIIRHKQLVKVDIQENNNKYWSIWEYDDNTISVEWGRVGAANPQAKTYPAYSKNFDALIRGKDKKSYKETSTVIGTNGGGSASINVTDSKLKKIAQEQIAAQDPLVAKLVDKLIQANAHNIISKTSIQYDESTGLFSTPLGIVTQSGIDQGRNILFNISQAPDLSDPARSTQKLIEDYLMIVPQQTNNRTNPVTLFTGNNAIAQHSDVLDSLQASLDSVMAGADLPTKTVKDEDVLPSVFNVSLELVEDDAILNWIQKAYKDTRHRGHASYHLKINRVFRIKIAGMSDDFEKDGAKLKNVWDLWHGTRVSNVLSIFAKGLIIPPSNASHCTGRMFGNGLYFTDQSTKASNYSYGYWDNGARDNQCYMFMCKVGMGKYYTPKAYNYSNYPVAKYDSTFAEAKVSGVQNNEMIVYRVSQANLEYLVEFTT